ncbi:S100P-binding protein [Pseudophryne corroboree]|uniref:S100P-binding protein n=1 Tax=Pseudophryne corroboree TaxID=495146 RepID=UPI0030821169
MRAVNESDHQSVQRTGADRQVLLYSSDCKDLLPGTMEEMKIRFVNDRATGFKRERDEVTSGTPESKRLRIGAFSCSTPQSACTTLAEFTKQGQVDNACHSQGQNPESCDEWDDSLLEPTDDDGNSPLYLTIDEIESLLVDDSADEPSGWDDENDTCVAPLISFAAKDDGEKESASLCRELDLSGTLTENLENDDDQNYAAVAPSPCNSVICTEELDYLSEQNDYVRSGVGQEEAISSNEKQEPKLTISSTKQNTTTITDSLLSLDPGQMSIAFVNAQAVVQKKTDPLKACSPSNDPDTLKVTSSSTASLVVTCGPHGSTSASAVGQDMKPSKSADNEETNNRQEVSATTSPTDVPVRSDNQIQISASVNCKKPGSSAPAKEKSLAAVQPIPRPDFRHILYQPELESNKNYYCTQVWMHMEGPMGAYNLQDPCYELASLLKRINSKDSQNWQHPTNFTRRNYPRSGKKPSVHCSLNQWVERNGGSKKRFEDIPSPFHRSPIPTVLSFGSS